jgi:tryptophan-rich sensory protein
MAEANGRTDGVGGLAAFAGITLAAAAWGARYSGNGRWYRRLRKPPFQPPAWLFGPVWTVLYATIAVSGWWVWRRRGLPEARGALGWWGAQLGLNAAWSWLFFGRRRPALALAELLALQAANLGYARSAARVDPKAAWLVAPYLGWVGFAGVLNEEIVRRNR